jgi:hypothetical protein
VTLQDQLGHQGSPIIGQNAWNLQELLKGRVTARSLAGVYLGAGLISPLLELALDFEGVHAGNILGSQDGGWGFNASWDISGSLRTVVAGAMPYTVYVPGGHLAPEQTGNLTDDQLKTNSFFLPFFDARLYQPEGSADASDSATRTRLLAEDVPARTFAVGANAFPKDSEALSQDNQFDMNTEFQQRGWPGDRANSIKRLRWLHADLHDMPYLYNGMLFDKFVELEGGR